MFHFEGFELSIVGVNGYEAPPVPIPNTEVKLIRVEDTWLVTAWENRSMPASDKEILYPKYSSIAQSVEHAAVNRRVVGSSPTWGARLYRARTNVKRR